MTALCPIGVPVSRPRSVLMIGVNGSFWANQRTPAGIEAVGTKALETNGRNCGISDQLLAPAGVLAIIPKPTHSQLSARVSRTKSPAAASHSIGVALGRKPRPMATPITSTALIDV